jgi:hypothetical protein
MASHEGLSAARRAAALIMTAAAVSAAGCGSSTPADKGPQPKRQIVAAGGGGREMSASDVGTVVAATRQINAACPQVIANNDAPPDPAAGVRTLIRVQRLAGPDAVLEYGTMPEAMPMRSYLSWEAGIIRRCGLRREAAQLQQAAAQS